MLCIIGKKIGMTRLYHGEKGAVPVTVIQAVPATVFRRKTQESDGYEAVVVGADPTNKVSRMKSAQKGEFKKYEQPYFRRVREMRIDAGESVEVGAVLGAERFKAGDFVDVTGVSKGRGFQGNVKRHGFGGGRASHGSGFHRSGGSTGMHTDPAKVIKGKRMPGRMGGERTTVLNLQVLDVRLDSNVILIEGAVPGHIKGWVMVRPAVKQGKHA